ncbi:MAG: hypothetical protein U1F53_06120 [Burkholderiaceae bacterium]
MRAIVLALGVLGAALFGGALVLSLLNPILVERAAREVVRIEVERRVSDKVEALSNAKVTDLALKALQKADVDIERTRDAIRRELPRRVGSVVADMLNADCECRQRLLAYMERAEEERLSSLTQLREQLVTLIESSYASVSQSLMREFRIFAASNMAAFALLAAIAAVRRKATLQLLLPAVVLVGSVAITGGMYLFSQNWLHTIVFSQYVGLAYVVYLVCVALLLADVVFNRARATTQMVNLLFSAVGAAATAVPC